MPENDQLIASSHIDLQNKIRERAHQLWLARTNGNGAGQPEDALGDWLQAEEEVLGDNHHDSAQNRGTTVGYAGTPDRETADHLGED
jgi:hypothetical protein